MKVYHELDAMYRGADIVSYMGTQRERVHKVSAHMSRYRTQTVPYPTVQE
jgi:hypothetical protein